MAKRNPKAVSKKSLLRSEEKMHERIERKQDREKPPMPSKKKALKEFMEGEEVMHNYMEEKLHGKGGSMPKSEYMQKDAAKQKPKKKKKERGMEIEIEIEMGKGKKKSPMPKKPALKSKMKKVAKEFKEGKLHSGSKKGPIVTNPKQMVAIGYSEARRGKKK